MDACKRRTVKVLTAVGMILLSIVVLWGIRVYKPQVNAEEAVEQKMTILEEAEARKGQYEDHHIVLEQTTAGRAGQIAEELGAELRISDDGDYAVLDLGQKSVSEVLAARQKASRPIAAQCVELPTQRR